MAKHIHIHVPAADSWEESKHPRGTGAKGGQFVTKGAAGGNAQHHMDRSMHHNKQANEKSFGGNSDHPHSPHHKAAQESHMEAHLALARAGRNPAPKSTELVKEAQKHANEAAEHEAKLKEKQMEASMSRNGKTFSKPLDLNNPQHLRLAAGLLAEQNREAAAKHGAGIEAAGNKAKAAALKPEVERLRALAAKAKNANVKSEYQRAATAYEDVMNVYTKGLDWDPDDIKDRLSDAKHHEGNAAYEARKSRQ